MDKTTNGLAVKTMDEYLAMQPEPFRVALENLRYLIKSIVPEAEETISYQIPTFKYHGGLVAFAGFKKHCSFFPMNSKYITLMQNELAGFKTAKGTIQFTTDKPIPGVIIKKIARARVKENLAKAKKQPGK
jgi:uncharacterized protein YdhG (YjbR/CyaY superfamily)